MEARVGDKRAAQDHGRASLNDGSLVGLWVLEGIRVT